MSDVIINPITNRPIKMGSKKHKDLLRKGIVKLDKTTKKANILNPRRGRPVGSIKKIQQPNDSIAERESDDENDKEAEKQFVGLEPVGRFGQPQEIANAVIWLCSDQASFVTGHAMAVDGGFVTQ